MARIRSLKPEIHMDEAIGVCSDAAYRLFTGLITLSDDYGRHKGNPRLLSSLIWPYQDRSVPEVEEYLAELEGHGLIIRYFHSGQPFIALPTWVDHQRVDNAGKERIPAPEDADGQQSGPSVSPPPRKAAATRREPPRTAAGGDQGARNKEQGEESAISTADAPLSDLLAELVGENTGRKPRVGKKWRDAERLLLERDKRDPVQAERLLRWSQRDEFWRGNILSLPKFRAQYDQLLLHAKRGQQGKREEQVDQRTSDEAWVREHLPDVPESFAISALHTIRLSRAEPTPELVRARLQASGRIAA